MLLVTVGCILNFTIKAQDSGVTSRHRIINELVVSEVWSGHPVGFDLLTTGRYQYVAFYDTARNMCIAQRNLQDRHWKFTILPTRVGWDSHNSIAMAIDRDSFLHVSGNMHVVPLIYFRSARPHAIETFEARKMLGVNEEKVTYPVFFKNQDGTLFFQYRDGSSGNGITFINRYDPDKKEWIRVLNQGLFDGEGETNAYPSHPVLGPDGYFHYCWVWRLNPIANTNHNLSYVRTKDFVHFENIMGKPIDIPIRYREREVIADPVGPWNGLMNTPKKLGFDRKGNVIIGYHKFDHRGVSQLFICRFEGDQWIQRQVSRWSDFSWEINARGSLGKAIEIGDMIADQKGFIYLSYEHKKFGKGVLKIADESLVLVEDMVGKDLQLIAGRPDTPSDGKQINQRFDPSGRFFIQWESLPSNFDKPRDPPFPEPSLLKIYEIESE